MLHIVRKQPLQWVGNGFPIHRAIDPATLGRKLNPFVLLDYLAPYKFEATSTPKGIEMHPHRGFETVTIAYSGHLTHKDSAGNTGTIHPGHVQWMTAGSGIEHEEKHSTEFSKQGGLIELVQLWVNIPSKDRWAPPAYQTLTEFPKRDGIEVISGSYNGLEGPAKTFTPMDLLNVDVDGSVDLVLKQDYVSSILVRRGPLTIDDEVLEAGDLAVVKNDVTLEGQGTCVVLSAEPLKQHYETRGPMVMDTNEDLRQAFRDYRQGKLMRDSPRTDD